MGVPAETVSKLSAYVSETTPEKRALRTVSSRAFLAVSRAARALSREARALENSSWETAFCARAASIRLKLDSA